MTSAKEITRLRDLKLSARDQLMLDPRTIQIEDGHNPRDYTLPENRSHLDWLKANIAENGTLQPLLVRYDPQLKAAVLVDGECRLRANLELIAQGVEILAVPTIQVPGNNQADRLLTAVTANTGKPLSKWELGAAFKRFRNFGWDDISISKRTGYSARAVTEAIELAEAPDAIKEMMSEHSVTPALALSEMRQNGAAAVDRLREKATAAKKKGEIAKREQPNRVPEPKQLLKLIGELLEGVEGDIFDAEFKFVEVKRETMVKLAKLVGISADGRQK